MQHGGHITKDLLGPRGVPVGGGGAAYQNRVLALSPIRYWPLDDAAGSAIARELVAADSGTPANVTFGAAGLRADGKTSAAFNGSNSYINIYSAALSAAFTGSSFTLLVWAMRNPLVTWNDTKLRMFVSLNQATPTYSSTGIRKNNSNQIRWERNGSGTIKAVEETPISGDAAYGYGLSVSETADTLKAFRSGAQIGTTQTGIGTWGAAGLRNGYCNIGINHSGALSFPMSGYLQDVAIFCPALTDDQIKSLTL